MSVVILGAGLTGLCTAHFFGGPLRIFEREERAGGLCRSFQADGFTFDVTGHLLHYSDARAGRFLAEMLPGSLLKVTRKAAIFSKGVFTKYPFQVNTFGLPPAVIEECLLGFVEAVKRESTGDPPASFLDWILKTFGDGFARHFFIPYNEKLFRVGLSEITPDWVSWSIPVPRIRDVVDGALGISREGFGYNAWFLYPESGGIEALVKAVARRTRPVETRMEAVEVRTRKKRVRFSTGELVPYEVLVSTLPLPRLIEISDLDAGMKRAARKLRYVSVLDVNLGVEGLEPHGFHWVYFPEKQYPFYRVGIASNFCPGLAPEGAGALYVEIAMEPGTAWREAEVLEQVRHGLSQCGMMGRNARVAASHIFPIEYAYVLYDRHRREALGPLLSHLEERGIYSIGRYGAWEYSTMEQAVLSGMAMGSKLRELVSECQ
jgi:protoporphyrinogen oxidase